jgi:hypothetical protein
MDYGGTELSAVLVFLWWALCVIHETFACSSGIILFFGVEVVISRNFLSPETSSSPATKGADLNRQPLDSLELWSGAVVLLDW